MTMISIIIPAFNEEANIPVIIQYLRNQKTKNFEIVIIDNNSKDKTYNIAKNLADRVYKCEKQGISETRNYGASKVKNEIIAFIDADSKPCEEWTTIIENSFCNDMNLTAVSGIVLYEHKNYFKRKFFNFYSIVTFYILKISNFFGNPSIMANNFAIKKSIYEKIGGFDNYVYEDYYFGLKLKQISGVNCIFDSRMKAEFSSRRFEEYGFFKTIFQYVKGIMKKIPQKEYLVKYKSK